MASDVIIDRSHPDYLRERIAELERIFAEIWGLAMTDCGPEEYALFPEMLAEYNKREREQIATLERQLSDLRAALEWKWHEMDEKPEPFVWVIVSDLHPQSPASSRLAYQITAIVNDQGEWCTMRNGKAMPFSLVNLNLRWKAWEWPVDALLAERKGE